MGGQVAPFIPVLTAHLGQQLARNQLFQGPLGWLTKLINETLTGYTPTKYDLARSQVGQGGDSSNDIVRSGIAARIADSLSPDTGSAVSQISSPRIVGEDKSSVALDSLTGPIIPDLTGLGEVEDMEGYDVALGPPSDPTDGPRIKVPYYEGPFPPVEASEKAPAIYQRLGVIPRLRLRLGPTGNILDGPELTGYEVEDMGGYGDLSNYPGRSPLPSGKDPFPGIMDPVTTQRVGDIIGGLGGLAVGIPLASRVAKMGKDPKAEGIRVPNYIQRGRGWNLKATARRPREVDISLAGVPGAKPKKDLIDLIRKRLA